MVNDVNIQIPAAYNKKIAKTIILQAVLETLQSNASENTELTVVLSSDERIKKLNDQYRGINTVTDVLSFPADITGFEDPDGSNSARYLGDIIISFPQTCRQADQGHRSVKSEITLLTVHGVLHLLGYDHDTKANKLKMWSNQNQILDRLGYPEAKVE